VTSERPETVARGAYFGGIALGGIVLAAGLYGVSALDAGSWSIPLEMAVVLGAMLATTAVWKWSARRDTPLDGDLDSPSGPHDRR
jgi:hypothetical protein